MIVAGAALTAYAALALAVRVGWTDAVDAGIRQFARPDDVWGPVQMRVDLVVEGLRPPVTAIVTFATVSVISVTRSSWRPLVFFAGVGLSALIVTVLSKGALLRPDPHGFVTGSGGSFPSGHTMTVVVLTGVVALQLPQALQPWVRAVPAGLGLLMGAALLVEGAHWGTDVAGAGLLAGGVLAVAVATGFRDWAAAPPPPRSS